jgi:hypothetical protein
MKEVFKCRVKRGDDGVKASSLIHGNGDRKIMCPVDMGICSK